MSHSAASLVNLWEYEGQNNATTSVGNKNADPNNRTLSPVKADLIKYYKKHGLENIAKEVGIIRPNGEITSGKNTNQPRELRVKVCVPYLYAELSRLLRGIIKKFVKPEKVVEGSALLKLDLNSKDSLLEAKSVDIGFGAKKYLKELK
ncbi:hypothetical protein AVEN_24861-1 [Araneus ventricosus]|uniref:Uncharacterized protein n=1 Tax=Araneus ventricosus TaxID=182803 RepID=A0A4Y2BUQ0_ARAVE|nr:hypothetical protein AVEN_24861-1 [Araneus ventricosus]